MYFPIPYLRMESAQTSNGAYVELPREEGESVACDETLLFPDGSGYHLTGIHMEYYLLFHDSDINARCFYGEPPVLICL